jgi:AmmeMemoRadiSam system protein B
MYKEYPFVLVNKTFDLPLGTIKSDRKAINQLLEAEGNYGITVSDRAHRMEHSIELHLLFLSYLWDHDFKVVPFLTRGFDDLYYMKDGYLGQQLSNFSELLHNQFAEDENTFFLISGDLAHFGKKFGDRSPASAMFEEVENFDRQFLKYGSSAQKEQMLDLMKKNMDPYRICGFPPLYTYLSTMPQVKGEILSYDLWDEQERESAVTFGSILYSSH